VEPSTAAAIDADARAQARAGALNARRLLIAAALLAAAAAVYASAAFGPPFYTKGEPREAIVTQRMLAEHDFVLPRRTATEIPAKPPLFHWLGAACSVVAGSVTEATVRAPSLLASLFAIALTVATGYAAFGTSAGLSAGVVLATSQQWIASSVTARVDMVLAAATAAALLSLWRARIRNAAFPTTFWIGCSLAVLAKGPVGYVLPVLIAVTLLLVRRDLSYLRTVRWGAALAILAVPLGWYLLAWQHGGREFLDKVVAENLTRMIDADAADLGHRHGAFYYVPALLAGMAPWSVLLFPAGLELWRARGRLLDESRTFALVWIGITIAFYSLADSKRPVYLLSCYPALALLIGDWLARRFGENRTPSPAFLWTARAMAVVASAIVALVALQSLGVPTFALFIRAMSEADQANLAALARAVESRPLALACWLLAIALLVAAFERGISRGRWRTAFAALALVVATTTSFAATTVFRDVARSQSVKPFIESALARVPPGYPLYFYGAEPDLTFFRSFEYAASFYARRPLELLHDLDAARPGEAVWFLAAEPTIEHLREVSSEVASPYRFVEIERYTYGDNTKRTPLVFVEARRN
jgi:4-amino-4-deoxy-L-arabinose transferase-like glycosyltransferase